jgi:Ser/Thr protein kinase RdoA (MazF antagonist)
MMKLSLMQRVVATLNDQYESPIADTIVTFWTHDQHHARYFRASANFIFTFTLHGQPSILRFAHASERTVEAIEAELAFLHHLVALGALVALPKRSLSGQYVESVSTPLGVFHAVAFERLPGEKFDVRGLSLDQFTRWGCALGALHQATEGYHGAGRQTIHEHLMQVEQRLPEHEHAARYLLSLLKHQIAALPVNERNFGLIHYDFELDNLLWNEHVSVIDFDDCARYWFIADIAFALRDLVGDQPIDTTDERFRAFVRGYRMVRTVTDEELLRLPLFLRMHNLVTFTKLLRAVDIDAASEGPAWVVDLRAKLLRKTQTYRAGFATARA